MVNKQKLWVKGAGGMRMEVLNKEEQSFFKDSLKLYMDQYSFENVSDLQDLDRVLGMELLSWRYSQWLMSGLDYDGLVFDEKAVKTHKKDLDVEIRLTKKHMGMDRKGRIADEAESVADYLTKLLRRAKEFGVHRDHQIAKSMDLMSELKKLMGLHRRTDEEEAHYLEVTTDDIMVWIRDVMIPEYDALDDAFRKNQRLWIEEISK